MTIERTLWQLYGGDPIDLAVWTQSLALHVRHSAFTTIAMRIGDLQRSYLALQGCGRCLRGDCTIGCHVSLFRRLVQACLPNGQLRPVPQPQGFALRPYTSATLCWPMSRAEPLTSDLLAAWPEARLSLHWTHGLHGTCVGGLLMATGDTPVSGVRAHGWYALPLPRPLLGWLTRRALPLPLPGLPWQRAPFVLADSASVV